ncbi:MAG: DUF92 domain-containing protein [Candidatus Bathyarchaeia archaeon]
MKILLLDFPGLIMSFIVGIAVLFFSKGFWIQNFILLLSFLLLGVIVTKWRHSEKREKGLYEHERGWKNVLSNGSIPIICCVMYYINMSQTWLSAFICSLAAATADKFGSELGVLSGKPINLRNFKYTRPGTSGAVSPLGTLMSFNGALMIGLISYALFSFDPIYIFGIGFMGFIGGLADTVAGIFEEMGFGTKSTSNIFCTFVGMALGYLFAFM